MINQLRSVEMLQGLFSRKGAIALVTVAVLLPACTSNQPEAAVPESEQNVTTEEVADDTEELIGQTVTVRDEVEATEEPNTFKLTDDEFFGGEEVLVINASGTPFLLPTDGDTEVQVSGEVRQFVIADIEREFGFDLDPTLHAEYEEEPAIIADSIALAPEPGEITEDPEQFYNQPIAVEGEVAEVRDVNSFTLNDEELFGGEDLLVLNASPTQTIEDGETVAVVGELRPFVVADIERDYDLTWDLETQQELEAEYREKPVFIAREVYPSAQAE